MANEINGVVPKMSFDYGKTIINRALQDVYRQSLWSFQLFESNWTSPAAIGSNGASPASGGTCTVVSGSNLVVFDPLIATPLINAIGLFPSPVTQRQFRVGIGTIYNIWALNGGQTGSVTTSGTALTATAGTFPVDGTVGNGTPIAINGVQYLLASVTDATHATLQSSAGSQTGVAFTISAILTLDRLYQEASGANIAYQIYQVYYPSPYADFKSWKTVRDIINFNDLILSRSRDWVDIQDPQRSYYYIPTHCVPYQNDQNPNSATYGWLFWELWGQPSFVLTYQLYGTRNGPALVNPTDTIPIQIGEDVVMAKARYYAYEWAEANRESSRGGGNFLMLKRETLAEYKSLYRSYRMRDRAAVDNFMTRCRTSGGTGTGVWEPNYSAIAGVANPGSPWG